MRTERVIFLISGNQGAGKSTIARALAKRFERWVHVEADLIQRMIVAGGVWPKPPEPKGEALRQLRERAKRSAVLADSFFEGEFTVVIDDIAIGDQFAVLMRPTWPETPPASADQEYEPLQPLLYSLDVFLPFVNLHQERYWWPKPGSSGEFRAVGMTFTFRGSIVRYYLWAQIIAGWLLSAIFVAGITGLMSND